MSSNLLKRRYPDGYEYTYPAKKQKTVLYLEDYTPIRTVEVTSLQDNVCPGYLRAYFECKIGPVSDVLIITRKLEEDQKTRVGYVTFTLPEDAAKLICGSNLLLNCKFAIKQAENVFQPKIDPNSVKFEEINNDCLVHVTSFLNLIDTISLGKTCRRLQTFVDHEIYSKRTHFKFGASSDTPDLSINQRNLPAILQEMGNHFKSIEWISLTDRQIDQMSEHCRNVQGLNLVAPNLHSNSVERNADWFKNLQSLQIEDADFFDVHIKAVIDASTHLESLQLIDCFNVKGDFLAEWNNSQLKDLRVVRCPGMSPSNVADFLRINKLTKFSSDGFDSFIMCLSLPTTCLYYYTELELAVNSSTDEKLNLLKFVELKRLEKMHLKSTFYNDRIDQDVTVAKNFNVIFTAMRLIPSLTMLSVERIKIDADTFKCLGSIQNLRELNLKGIYNEVGTEMYSSLAVHLSQITRLSMSMVNKGEREPIDVKAIGDMIFALADLKYLSHSNMTWELLNEIRNVQMIRKQPSPLEIGISPLLFRTRRKVDFVATSEGAVILSTVK